MEQEKIVFTTSDNEKVEFYVMEQTMINGTNYLLVTDDLDEEEAYAVIFKEVANMSEEVVYEEVEDDVELEAISKVFAELMDEYDIEIEND